MCGGVETMGGQSCVFECQTGGLETEVGLGAGHIFTQFVVRSR